MANCPVRAANGGFATTTAFPPCRPRLPSRMRSQTARCVPLDKARPPPYRLPLNRVAAPATATSLTPPGAVRPSPTSYHRAGDDRHGTRPISQVLETSLWRAFCHRRRLAFLRPHRDLQRCPRAASSPSRGPWPAVLLVLRRLRVLDGGELCRFYFVRPIATPLEEQLPGLVRPRSLPASRAGSGSFIAWCAIVFRHRLRRLVRENALRLVEAQALAAESPTRCCANPYQIRTSCSTP